LDYKTHIILEFGNPFVHVRPPIKDTSAQHDGWRTEEHLELGHFTWIILACSKVAHCSAKNESDKKIFKQIDNFALGLRLLLMADVPCILSLPKWQVNKKYKLPKNGWKDWYFPYPERRGQLFCTKKRWYKLEYKLPLYLHSHTLLASLWCWRILTWWGRQSWFPDIDANIGAIDYLSWFYTLILSWMQLFWW